MTLRVKIASAILFVIFTLAQYWHDIPIKSMLLATILATGAVSFVLLLIIISDISVWLKLFLLGASVNTVYSYNPAQVAVYLSGVVLLAWIYYYATKFQLFEVKQLLSAYVVFVLLQVGWILLEVLYVKYKFLQLHKHVDMCGTIGYVNLAALLLASSLPLIYLYRKKLVLFPLLALVFCNSITSIAALTISLGVFFFEKSKRYIIIALILLLFAMSVGIPRIMKSSLVRIDLWEFLIKEEVPKKLWFGKGFGSFKLLPVASHQLDRRPDGNIQAARRAHNAFIQLTLEGGLICTIPIIGFMIMTFVNFVRCKKTRLQKALFGSLCGFYVGLMVDFPDRNIPMVCFMLILLVGNAVFVRKNAEEVDDVN